MHKTKIQQSMHLIKKKMSNNNFGIQIYEDIPHTLKKYIYI